MINDDDEPEITSDVESEIDDDEQENDIEDNIKANKQIYLDDEDEDIDDTIDDDLDEEDNEDLNDEVLDEEDNKKNMQNDNYLNDKNYKNIFINNDDYENIDSMEFLQKFNDELKDNYILNYHNECLNKNNDEINKLLKISKNKDNVIIDEFHKTNPLLTKYEKTKILGIRLKQLNNNAKPYINIKENNIDNLLIANLELTNKKLPFIIQRPMPNNTFEYWRLQDLEIL